MVEGRRAALSSPSRRTVAGPDVLLVALAPVPARTRRQSGGAVASQAKAEADGVAVDRAVDQSQPRILVDDVGWTGSQVRRLALDERES